METNIGGSSVVGFPFMKWGQARSAVNDTYAEWPCQKRATNYLQRQAYYKSEDKRN